MMLFKLSLYVHKYNAGIARGCGWQKIGAYVNLGSYYIVGIPSAVLLAFVLHIGGRVKNDNYYDLCFSCSPFDTIF